MWRHFRFLSSPHPLPSSSSRPLRVHKASTSPIYLCIFAVLLCLSPGGAESDHVRCEPETHCFGSNCHSAVAFDTRFCPDCSCIALDDARLSTQLCRIASLANKDIERTRDLHNITTAKDPFLLRAESLSNIEAWRPKPHCASLDALLQGEYVAPCVDCQRISSCTLSQARWQPKRCELRPGPAVSYPLLAPHATVVFMGDSTLRGVYEALLQLAGHPPVPHTMQHANHSALLHDDVLVMFRYYPPWEEIRNDAAVVATFPPFEERFRARPDDSPHGFIPQAADFLLQLKPQIAPRLAARKDARVLIVHGGIMMRPVWVNDVRLLEDDGALLPSPERGRKEAAGRVLHVFAANGPRSGNACGMYRGLSASEARADPRDGVMRSSSGGDPLEAIVQRQAATMAWFPRCPLLEPLYPGLVRKDKCLCHFHWSVGSSGRVAGPGVIEQLRVLLHAWHYDLFVRGDGSAQPLPLQRLTTDADRFQMHELQTP